MVANQYGLEIRLWTLWIRSNAPDMWSNSLRGFTKLSKSDQGKIFQTQTYVVPARFLYFRPYNTTSFFCEANT